MCDTVRIARCVRLAALIILLTVTGLGLSACESSHPQGDTAASALGGWR